MIIFKYGREIVSFAEKKIVYLLNNTSKTQSVLDSCITVQLIAPKIHSTYHPVQHIKYNSENDQIMWFVLQKNN